jgi:hypothetical protein
VNPRHLAAALAAAPEAARPRIAAVASRIATRAGVPGSRRDWTEAPETREAWNRLGETFLAEGRDAEWALKTFGKPRRDA